MARGKLYKRRKNIRNTIPVALIVCEGSKTEIKYFKYFKKRRGIKIELINDKVADAVNIVKSALKIMERYGLEINNNDSLWTVFDCDENSQIQLEKSVSKKLIRNYLCLLILLRVAGQPQSAS